jgi:antitoxin component HigA of HigAB toxin-antitoxin module
MRILDNELTTSMEDREAYRQTMQETIEVVQKAKVRSPIKAVLAALLEFEKRAYNEKELICTTPKSVTVVNEEVVYEW